MRFSLPIARLSSTIWVGAALLFVATSVAEQVHPDLDASTKGLLALIRFPWFYGTAATLLAIGFVASVLAARGRRAVLAAAGLLALALALLAIDYWFVYRELVNVLLDAGKPPASRFAVLHAWSERLNAVGFLLSATAAAILCAVSDRATTGRVESRLSPGDETSV